MRWFMLPVSAAAHVAAFLLTLIVPLATGVEAPTPWPVAGIREFIAVTPVPPPPCCARCPRSRISAARPRPRRRSHRESTDAQMGPVVDGSATTSAQRSVCLRDCHRRAPPSPHRRRRAEAPAYRRRGDSGAAQDPDARRLSEIARAARVEGLVILEATIDERGFVTDARVLGRCRCSTRRAALKQWRYTPTCSTAPVRVLMTVTFRFSLGDRDL